MLKKSIYIVALIILISLGETYSQPSATVTLIGGYTFPLGVLKKEFGSMPDSLAPETDRYYYLTYGYNYGASYKQGLGKKKIVRITGSLNFTLMGQTKDYSSGETDKLRQSFISLGVGADVNLAPKRGLFNPFGGAEITASFFGGSLQRIQPTVTTTYNLNAAIRWGLNLEGGLDIQFHQSIGCLVGLKYVMVNILGKKFEQDLGTSYNLNDAAHTSENVSYPARDINVLKIYGGFSYYFGR